MRLAPRTGFLLLAATLGACSLAPTYKRPDVATAPASFQETHDWKIAAPADAAARGNWWEIFNDPELNALEAKVTNANQDIKAAFAHLQQARAVVRENRAGYMPTVTASASSQRLRESTNKPFYNPSVNPTYGDDVLGADFSWELDVFGRVRNLVAGSKARAEASAADLAALDLSTHAELASDYFSLRGDDAEQTALGASVSSYQKALELTQNLYKGGAAAAVDVAQSQLQLQNAMTQAADVRLQRKQMQHAIAVLVGESAATFSLPAATLTCATPGVDPGLPSPLLERRPELAAAERLVAAANADIGVARAAYFPVFGLNAAAGFESTSPSTWIKAPSRFWSIGPSATLNLFNPAIGAVTDQAHAAYDETVANYRQTVLLAYQDVEDGLAAMHELGQESTTQAAASAAAQQALMQASNRYHGGIASYLEVVVAQNAALQAQLAVTSIQVRQLSASVQLIKALGGGWTPDDSGAKQ